MEIDGKNGAKIELLDDMLVIRRYGMGSFFSHGLKGEKRIPYKRGELVAMLGRADHAAMASSNWIFTFGRGGIQIVGAWASFGAWRSQTSHM